MVAGSGWAQSEPPARLVWAVRSAVLTRVFGGGDAEGARQPDHAFDVRFKDKVVGKCVADLFIADRFIVQIMSRPGEIGSYERAALRAQLRAADLELDLLNVEYSCGLAW